jgi:hypothetical protein
VDVADLAGRLGVAQRTVRRDLRALEEAGRRVHGGAVALDAPLLAARAPVSTSDVDDLGLSARVWAELLRRLRLRPVRPIDQIDLLAVAGTPGPARLQPFLDRGVTVSAAPRPHRSSPEEK